jgi:hypothetical protein
MINFDPTTTHSPQLSSGPGSLEPPKRQSLRSRIVPNFAVTTHSCRKFNSRSTTSIRGPNPSDTGLLDVKCVCQNRCLTLAVEIMAALRTDDGQVDHQSSSSTYTLPLSKAAVKDRVSSLLKDPSQRHSIRTHCQRLHDLCCSPLPMLFQKIDILYFTGSTSSWLAENGHYSALQLEKTQ